MCSIEIGDRRIQDGLKGFLRKALSHIQQVSQRSPDRKIDGIPSSSVVFLVVCNPPRVVELAEYSRQKQKFRQPLLKVRVELCITKQQGDPIGITDGKLNREVLLNNGSPVVGKVGVSAVRCPQQF